MILKSIQNKNTKKAVIWSILFFISWSIVFSEGKPFWNLLFSSSFGNVVLPIMVLLFYISPLFIIKYAFKGLVHNDEEEKSGTEKFISKFVILIGLFSLIGVASVIYVILSIGG